MRVKLKSRGNEQKQRYAIKFYKQRFPNAKCKVNLGTQINENLYQITIRIEKAGSVLNRLFCLIVWSRCIEVIQNYNRV